MTISNYVRAGIVGLALMAGCKYEAPQRSEYNFNCGKTNDLKEVCAQFDAEKRVTSFTVGQDSQRDCFYTAGYQEECKPWESEVWKRKSQQMSPSLEKAANDFFRGQNELAFGIDQARYDAVTRK